MRLPVRPPSTSYDVEMMPSKRAFDRIDSSPFGFLPTAKRNVEDLVKRKTVFDQVTAANFGFGPRRFFYRRGDGLIMG
ncbi:hypothetical protein AAVH_06479 [Aphelenchoides avenae]|nr:hypothetical protein AAVH_06479 [Aphelenchus avenae]